MLLILLALLLLWVLLLLCLPFHGLLRHGIPVGQHLQLAAQLLARHALCRQRTIR